LSPHQRSVADRLDTVPTAHIAGLRAALAGFDDEQLALLLSVPVESVRPTLSLAAAKVASALRDRGGKLTPPRR